MGDGPDVLDERRAPPGRLRPYSSLSLRLFKSVPIGSLPTTRPSHPDAGQTSEYSFGAPVISSGLQLRDAAILWPFVQVALRV